MSSTASDDKWRDPRFLEKLSSLLDASPEKDAVRISKRRRLEEILNKACRNDEEKTTSHHVQPWSYEDFLFRLRSFRASTWFAMPSDLSPLECARFGWVNKSPSTLGCLSCSVELKYSDDIPIEDFREAICSKHEPLCGWTDNPCPESFSFFPIRSESETRLNFIKNCADILSAVCNEEDNAALAFMLSDFNYTSVQAIVDNLLVRDGEVGPLIGRFQALLQGRARMTESFGLIKKLYNRENDGIIIFPLAIEDVDFAGDAASIGVGSENIGGISLGKAAAAKLLNNTVILALFGWNLTEVSMDNEQEGVPPPHSFKFCCDTCARNVPAFRAASDGPLNPVREHRFFCPWVASKSTQCDTGFECRFRAVFGSGNGKKVTNAPAVSNASEMYLRIKSVVSSMSTAPFSGPSK